MKVKSDPALLAEVRKYGKFNTNACFQCGSCTVICDLTNDSTSFPRKTVRYVLSGLRGLLHSSLEPWICHDCGDCSIICPRQAEPRESMATLRRYLSSKYDWTGLSSKISSSKLWHIGSLLSAGVLFLLMVVLYHRFMVRISLNDFATTSLGLEHMFGTITYFTLAVIFLPLFLLITFALRMYWFTMRQGSSLRIPFILYIKEAKTFILHSVTHKKLGECPEKIRWPKHWMLAFGCVLMFLILIFFLQWFQTDNFYPVYHPQRWLGYLATVFIIFGTTDILIGRIKKRKEIHKFSELGDFTLPILLLLTAVTGIAVHIFRYLGLEMAAHYAYILHLFVTIPMLLVEIPFGKLSHMISRPLAIYFQKVKERALERQLPKDAALEYVK